MRRSKLATLARQDGSLLQFANAFSGTDHIREPDSEFLIDHYNFAVRNQCAIDIYIKRFPGGPIELNDGALIKLQQVADADATATHFHRQCDGNIEHDIQVDVTAGALRRPLGLQILQRCGLYLCVHIFPAMMLCSIGGRRLARRSEILMACWPRELP